jgi:PEGA domain/Stigma-specific protein, Stig1
MRLFCALLLVFLVIAGPVAAITVNPSYQPLVTMAPKITMVTRMPATTVPELPMLSIGSVPSGAAVTVDGTGRGITPVTIALYPGSYTVVLSLDGYRDYTTTVTLVEGQNEAIEARLVPVLTLGALRRNVSAIAPAIPAGVINLTTLPVPVTTTRGMTHCPPDQKCMTLAEAEAALQPGWEPAGTGPCDRVLNADNEVIGLKYCIVGNLKPTLQPGSVHAMVTVLVISPGPLASITQQPVQPNQAPQVLGAKRQVGVIESFFGFISGFISHPVCPTGQTVCGGKCIDPMSDSQNCGSCDYTCFDPAVCINGTCDNPTIPQPDVGGLL